MSKKHNTFDMIKEYHALDMANGMTYIGWMDFQDVLKTYYPNGKSLEAVLATKTITATDFDENGMQMIPREYYIRLYREYAPKLRENEAFQTIELYAPLQIPLKVSVRLAILDDDIKIRNPNIIADLDLGENILSNRD